MLLTSYKYIKFDTDTLSFILSFYILFTFSVLSSTGSHYNSAKHAVTFLMGAKTFSITSFILMTLGVMAAA
jgi:hypothetical protein